MPERESAGFLRDDVPYVRIGHGPPLVSVLGLTPENDVPEGLERRFVLGHARAMAAHFTVYVVNRARGLRPGESMSDIAGHLANAIEHDLGQPVFLMGNSTGGSVALQMAVDRPDLVRRLVLTAAAYRLGPRGRELQAEMARLIRAGKSREAWASVVTAMLPRPLQGPSRPLSRFADGSSVVTAMLPRPLQGPSRPLSRLAVGSMVPDDPSDVLVTLDAEDAFDVEAALPRVTAPTLVIGGSRDPFYSPELFQHTASGVQDGRVHLFPGWGHGRTSASSATTHLTLGFMLAGVPDRQR